MKNMYVPEYARGRSASKYYCYR